MVGRIDGKAVAVDAACGVGQVPSDAAGEDDPAMGIGKDSTVGDVAGSAFLERYPVGIVHAGIVVEIVVVRAEEIGSIDGVRVACVVQQLIVIAVIQPDSLLIRAAKVVCDLVFIGGFPIIITAEMDAIFVIFTGVTSYVIIKR